MLEVVGLRSGYGRIAVLNGVDLAVGAGEFVGILGHNGAGKSTLLKALMGVVPAFGGGITLCGTDITRHPTHRRTVAGLGYVPQGRQIFPALSVRENLMMGAFRSGMAIEAMLDLFPRLTRLLDRPGGALSGGEQQLLALARCLCGKPRLMLLDEPTEGIQPSIIEEMAETLVRVNAEHGIAIVLVEQNLEFLAALARTVRILKRGHLDGAIDAAVLRDADALAALIM